MDQSMMQEDHSFKTRASRFLTQCLRVLRVTRKPDRAEFTMLLKVSGIGVAVIGMIGFLLHLVWTLLALTPVPA